MTRFGYRKPEIGEGLVGRVYPAFRLDEDGEIIEEGFGMKILLDRWRESTEMVARFQREVRLQQEELDHPNIMTIVARNLSADPPWFAMPLASHDLKQELAKGLHEDHDRALEIFRQVAEAMAHAHERKVLHRDLKPGNVMFVDGSPCVCDFGFGKRAVPDATDLTQTDQWFGSQRYMAPEQLTAKEATAASDVYSLGKILGEMLTGERPEPFVFDADRMPTDYRYFLRRCCDSDPAKRYQSAGEMLDAFRVLTAASEVVDPPLEGVDKLVQQWMSTPEGPDIEYIRALDGHYTRYRDEEELYSRTLPRLPHALVEQYMVVMPEEFRSLVETYDHHISGSLAFSYCDVVADFYASIWEDCEDLDVKRIILARLWELGPSHNRWHVGEVLAGLLGSITGTSDAMLASDVIRAAPERAEWHRGYLRHRTLPRSVRDAVDSALDATAAEDDLPLG